MYRQSRRDFLRHSLALGGLLAAGGGLELVGTLWQFIQQKDTWVEASRPTGEFFARHASGLSRLSLGASFAPEQFGDQRGDDGALNALDLAVRELGMKPLRLGLRWDRTAQDDGSIDLSFYAPFLDYCFANGVEVCLNTGPIRVFRWPEEHVPNAVLSALPRLPPAGARIGLDAPLAQAGLEHIDRLHNALKREYGTALRAATSVQIENEPFYPLGQHRWTMDQPYLVALAERAETAMPGAKLLITTAARLNIDAVRNLFQTLIAEQPSRAGRLTSGFDLHYETPQRATYPVIRYLDPVSYATPFGASLAQNVWDSRDLGYSIEVTEGQMEPFAQFQSPGNSARDLRFLILRTLDRVLDPERPALIRLWGIELLTQHMQRNDLTAQHREMIEIIRRVNAGTVGEYPKT
ncbi:MAG TPA: twin-arginine translocation signal domain-containing protein [Dehalococcoidia bacterium]|nr:twin-arginine translocation signal domain-containing protein [Dehalococcoidia bacterium]